MNIVAKKTMAGILDEENTEYNPLGKTVDDRLGTCLVFAVIAYLARNL